MPKDRPKKFYAVLNGRGGAEVYTEWSDCHVAQFRNATHAFSGSSSKSFITYEEARGWLENACFSKPRRIVTADGSRVMSPTSLAYNLHASPRSKYVSSSRYWQDHRSLRLVDVGVQTICTLVPPTSPLTPTDSSRAPLQKVSQHWAEKPTAPALGPPTPPVELSAEQKRVLELVKSGRSIFFTGAAGTGKSVLLREIIRQLRQTLGSRKVAVTATTGIAGVNIGGTTVHSFAGIGLGKEKAEKLADRIKRSISANERWNNVQVLIVDEVSMMDGQLFDKLEYIARFVRNSHEPFGGIQLVLSGDFYQLPPVPEQSYEHSMPSTFAFDAKTWSKCISQMVSLEQVFRQTDNTFVDILSSMRLGDLSDRQVEILKKLSRPLHYYDGIEPSEIFPLKSQVEGCNKARLAALPGPEHIFCSIDRAGYDYWGQRIPKASADKLLDRSVQAKPRVILKAGAQVMLVQNIVQGTLVNGSVGKVIEFLTTHEALSRKIMVAEMSKNPSEGIPNSELYSLSVSDDLDDHGFGRHRKWPLVHFTNGVDLLCAPLEFSVQGYMANTEVSRLQIPLILAWALSVHKSQGQTLNRVKLDLSEVFEKGQAYVAVSRATTMEHLEIVNFDPSKILAHPRVIQWHENWAAQMVQESIFEQEMDSEEAISQYWNDFNGWDDTRDDWNGTEGILPILPTELSDMS